VYDGSDSGLIASVSPAALPAGVESMVEITGVNTNFQDGQVRVGLGSSDATVRRVWVLSPTRILANVAVAANAPAGGLYFSLFNGLHTYTQAGGFAVQPATRQLSVNSQGTNGGAAQPLYAGSPVTVQVSNLSGTATAQTVTVTVNDLPAQVLSVTGGQVTFVAPSALPAGPAVLRLRSGADAAAPVVIPIDPPAPSILAVQASGGPVDAARPVRVGDQITLVVANIVSDVPTRVTAGGVDQTVQAVAPAGQTGLAQIQFLLTGSLAPGSYPLTVSQEARVSAPFSLPVR
jgi:uncharacterized protein (TIGR03437 family)